MKRDSDSKDITYYVRRPAVAKDRPKSNKSADLVKWQWWTKDLQRNSDSILVNGAASDHYTGFAHLFPASEGDKLIRMFCRYYECGVYPPEELMKNIYLRFSNYLRDNLKGKHEADLGFYFDGTNRRKAWKKLVDMGLEEESSLLVWVLMKRTNYTKTKAIEVVASWLDKKQNELPPEWQDKRPKKIGALIDFFKTHEGNLEKSSIDPPDDEMLLATLETLGELLEGYPDLDLIREGLRKKSIEGRL